MNITQVPVSDLAYMVLTVQPMYLYADDIEYIREKLPEALIDVNAQQVDVPPLGPLPGTKKLLEMMSNNGWRLIKGQVGDETYFAVDRLVCEYRKLKYVRAATTWAILRGIE